MFCILQILHNKYFFLSNISNAKIWSIETPDDKICKNKNIKWQQSVIFCVSLFIFVVMWFRWNAIFHFTQVTNSIAYFLAIYKHSRMLEAMSDFHDFFSLFQMRFCFVHHFQSETIFSQSFNRFFSFPPFFFFWKKKDYLRGTYFGNCHLRQASQFVVSW